MIRIMAPHRRDPLPPRQAIQRSSLLLLVLLLLLLLTLVQPSAEAAADGNDTPRSVKISLTPLHDGKTPGRREVHATPAVAPFHDAAVADPYSVVEEGKDVVATTAREPLGCVGWRGVRGCQPETEHMDPRLSLPCHVQIESNLAGWCECSFEFRVRESSCKHDIFRCDEQCAIHTAVEAQAKEESAERQELSPTDSVVAEFMQQPSFNVEFAPAYVGPLLAANKPFAIWMLCDCDDDVRWAKPIEEMMRLPEWEAEIQNKFVFGYARTAATRAFQLLDNFAIEGAPALGIDNIPIGQNMEKYTFRASSGGQLKWRPEIGQPPPEVISGRELADFFLMFLNRTLPLTVKSAPVPERRALTEDGGGGGGALEIVGSTFRDVVLDEQKDVAVFFYAPWCGGSSLVMPIIDRAADTVSDVAKERRLSALREGGEGEGGEGGNQDDDVIRVVKMDLTQNDIPVRGISVRTYPALWLFPRGQKDAPLEYAAYNNERTDGDGRQHSHYELGMVLDFLTDLKEHHVRQVHRDGGHADHLWDA